jgi:hypothetical protein
MIGGLVAGGGAAYGAQQAIGQQSVRVAIAPDAVFSGKVSAVKAVVSAANNTSNSTKTPTLIPGMSLTISVPAHTTAVIDARFSAETSCSGGGSSSNWCVAEIRVDGKEARPGDGSDFAFSSTQSGVNTVRNWSSNAMERLAQVSSRSTATTHTIQVLGFVTDFSSTGTQEFWTGERSLVVDW